MINQFRRYQVGLTLESLYPKINGKCACGCGQLLTPNRKKWSSDKCRESSFINFAIIKGDTSIIRKQLYLRDLGICARCGLATNQWEADHINPISNGGGACGLDNLQTLCLECHKIKTHRRSHLKAPPKLVSF